MIKLTILGNNSALPAYGRHPTAQIVSISDQNFLVDCGESTQSQLQKYRIGWKKINYIFISHLHGDHYFGLIGLLTSMGLLGRKSPIYLFGPQNLMDIIRLQLNLASNQLPYPIYYEPISNEGSRRKLIDTPQYSISCFPVEHRIPCHGFKFTSKSKGRKLIIEKCRKYNIPITFYKYLQKGEDYISEEGVTIKNSDVTIEGNPDVTYAYCADTLFTHSYLEDIVNVDAIYHESTYLNNDENKAKSRFHSTAAQAAEIAYLAKAKTLFLGHFSSKYKDLTSFQKEAQCIFSNVLISEEGTTYNI